MKLALLNSTCNIYPKRPKRFVKTAIAIMLITATLLSVVPGIHAASSAISSDHKTTSTNRSFITIRSDSAPTGFRTKQSSNPNLSPLVISTTASSSVAAATGFLGSNQKNSGCPCVPPDVILGVGPNHVVEMVNLARSIYTRAGSLVLRQNLSNFYSLSQSNHFLSDPKVLYDAVSQRWFASILDCNGQAWNSGCPDPYTGQIELAVSNSTDPTRFWRFYTIVVGANILPDQPIIGVNDDKFIVSANLYNNTATFLGAKYWVINKNDLLTGAPLHLAAFGPNINLESVHPVQTLSSSTTAYMVSTGGGDLGNSTTVKLFSVTGVPGVSNVTVTSTTFTLSSPLNLAPPVPQPCPRSCNLDFPFLDPGDNRVQDAAWYKGGLWLGADGDCQPNGISDKACIRLIKIDTGSLTKLQDFDFAPSVSNFFYPGLKIDSMGNLDMIYGQSSGGTPALYISGQAINDPAGSMAPPVFLRSGGGNTYGTIRFGDYFGAAVDPNEPSTVWVAGEFMNRSLTGFPCTTFSGCWDTFITHMRERPSITFSGSNTFTGVTVTTTGSLQLNATFSGTLKLSGTTSVVAKNSTTGIQLFAKNYTITNLPLTNQSGTAPYDLKFLLNVGVSPYALSSNIDIAFSGTAITPSIGNTRNLDINLDGIVNQTDLNIVSAAFGCSIGASCYNPKADVNADGTVDISDLAQVAIFYLSKDFI